MKTALRQYWPHLLAHALVIYGLYLWVGLDSSQGLAALLVYIPVALIFLGFAFGCHKGFRWGYLLLLVLVLMPAALLAFLLGVTAGTEIFLYIPIGFLGLLLGFGMRSVLAFFTQK